MAQNIDAAKFKYSGAFLALIIMSSLAISGCAKNSLFRQFSSDGAPLTGLAGASAALDKGNYDTAISLAQEVIDSETAPTEDKKEAYFAKGMAILGQSNITAVDLVQKFKETPDDFETYFSGITVEKAKESADAITAGLILEGMEAPDENFGSTTVVGELHAESVKTADSVADAKIKDRYLMGLDSNVTSLSTMFQFAFNYSKNELSVKTENFDNVYSALDYLFDDRSGAMVYASRLAVIYTRCGLSPYNQIRVNDGINAIVYMGYINQARKQGNPYIYVGSDGRKIRPSSSEQEVLAAIQFEISKLK